MFQFFNPVWSACRGPHFSLSRQRKVSKRKATQIAPDPALLRKFLPFRRDIHVSTSLKRTSCTFCRNFLPLLGELTWEGNQKRRARARARAGSPPARAWLCRDKS